MIHGHWLRRYGIDGTYAKEAVKPEEVASFIGSLAERGLAGSNVTVPHKEAAFAAAAERDAAAVSCGAANTLWFEGGRLCAANTDTYGFMTHLGQSAPGWDRRDGPVSILGAGGSARCIVHGFLEAGIERVQIFNRTRARAEALAAHFGPRVVAMDWAERSTRSGEAIVMVNTTTLGMVRSDPLELDLSALADDCVIADLVYVPLETDLLARARARDLRAVDGLGMLLHQAVPGFERWFGVKPEVTAELRAVVEADIEGR
jgi:shikimate dehydrogenase